MIPSFEPVIVGAPREMPEANYILIQDRHAMLAAIEVLKNEKVLAVDTETTGFDPLTRRILLVQISTQTTCYIFDAVAIHDLTPLKRLLTNGKILKLLQNAKFDWKFLQQRGIEINNLYDTYLAERLLTAGLGMECNLKAICKRYYNYDMSKAEVESFAALAEMEDKGIPITNHHIQPHQLVYACRDVLALFGIYEMQCEKLEKEGLLRVAWVEFNAVPVFAEMELVGFNVDPDLWRINLDKAKKALREEEAQLMAMIPGGDTKQLSMFEEVPDKYQINLGSRPQLLKILTAMEIDVDNTQAGTLSQIDNPFVKLFLTYRGNDKIVNAFGDSFLAFIHPRTGRVHSDYRQLGADSGRVSCGEPNLQQIPHDSAFRDAFVAPVGYKIITCDYSSCELRILGYLSGDPEFRAAFESDDIDLHTLTASKMFGHDYYEMKNLIDKIDAVKFRGAKWASKEEEKLAKEYKELRGAAKAINFGLAYGMGAGGLAKRINVSEYRAKELIEAYFGVYRGVKKWLDKAAKKCREQLFSETIIGRRWYHPAVDKQEVGWQKYNEIMGVYERRGKNGPIQGSNADMTKYASILIRRALRDGGYDARQVNQVHDEIVVEVREDQAEVVRDIVMAKMLEAEEAIIPGIPAKADPKISDRWEK